MFGYVIASTSELSPDRRERYHAVYCGICRRIGAQCSQGARLALGYDCAFLAMLLMSLYEPEELSGKNRCPVHPVTPKLWLDNAYIRYAADLNVALAWYKAQDDWHDDRSLTAKALGTAMQKGLPAIEARYPRQCQAIRDGIQALSLLESENSPDIDRCAGCFGTLLGEIFVVREDLWAPTLREMGNALGRFLYLADAAQDYAQDKRKGRYNPYLAMGCHDPAVWRAHLVLTMGRASEYYEQLPLVQDKDILDNIIYSGVWTRLSVFRKEGRRDRSV